MLDTKAMRAIGRAVAMYARGQITQDSKANDVIDFAPLLKAWTAGTAENPVTYAMGDVRVRDGVPYTCAQGHTHRGEPGWGPGEAPALWAAYHATDADHALPYQAPTAAHDAYNAGEWMVWTDGVTHRCLTDGTVWPPDVTPERWEAVDGQDGGESSEPGGTETAPDAEEWPAWYAWDGVGTIPWQNGSQCTHNGTRYISRVDNNHWEPGAPGVYDKIWEAQT